MKQKTLLQRLQSRISTRGNHLKALEERLHEHYLFKEEGITLLFPEKLKETKSVLLEGAASQKLDRQIFQVLLQQERDKYGTYFRSKHKHWLAEAVSEPWHYDEDGIAVRGFGKA